MNKLHNAKTSAADCRQSQTDKITLSYGSGGKATQKFIREYLIKHFSNPELNKLLDSAVLSKKFKPLDKLAFTTDAFVVNPIFFAGGDIGKLSVCGTINDLTAVGAEPLAISCALVIQEGLEIETVEKVLKSIAKVCETENIPVVTGDTKVVDKNACDKIFVITSGIGIVQKNVLLDYKKIKPGDKIIINGNIAEHGFAVLLSRGSYGFDYKIESDCAPLWKLIKKILTPKLINGLKFFRDPTRGGVAAVLNEVVDKNSTIGIKLFEEQIPISPQVKSISEILGIDPLYVANEGKMLVIASVEVADKIVEIFKSDSLGKNTRIIGEVTTDHKGKVVLKTIYGSHRIVDMPVAEQLPRIC